MGKLFFYGVTVKTGGHVPPYLLIPTPINLGWCIFPAKCTYKPLYKPGRCFFINDNIDSSPLPIANGIINSFFMTVPALVICITTINHRTPRHVGIQVIKFQIDCTPCASVNATSNIDLYKVYVE